MSEDFPNFQIFRDYWLLKSKYKFSRFKINLVQSIIKKNISYLGETPRSADLAPVFVIGAPRSGNTLLSKCLHEEFNIYFPPENYYLLRLFSLIPLGFDCWRTYSCHARSIILQQEDGYRWNPLRNDSIFFKEIEKGEKDTAGLINAIYNTYLYDRYGSVGNWGCKTPNLTPYVGVLSDLFPNAKFVHIVRDPSSSVNSMMTNGIVSNDPKGRIKAINIWRFWNENAFSLYRRRNYRVIKFSEFIENLGPVLTELGCWLEINPRSAKIKSDNPDIKYPHLKSVAGNIDLAKAHSEAPSIDVLDPLFKKIINSGKSCL